MLISGLYLLCLCLTFGIWLWFGAPNTQRMPSLSFAWHWHGACAHVHRSSHSKIVESNGLLLKFHVLISVKNHVNLLVCNVWAMGYTVLLWCDILRPFMCWFSQVDRRWGHVSLALSRHSV